MSIVTIICAAPDAAFAQVIGVGDTVMFDTSVQIPRGWLVCDGRWVEIAKYPDLFAAIGHRFSGGPIRRFFRGHPAYFRLPDDDQAQDLLPMPYFSKFHELRGKL